MIAMQHACPDARLAGTYNSVGHMSSFATVSCHAWNSLQVARQPRSAGFRPCNAQAQKWRGPLLPGCRLPLQNGQVFVRQRGAAGDRGSAARAGLHPPASTFGSGSARRPCSCSWSSQRRIFISAGRRAPGAATSGAYPTRCPCARQQDLLA